MTIEDMIEEGETHIALLRVELEDWIPAKCLIDDRIKVLKASIESWGEYIQILLEEAGK